MTFTRLLLQSLWYFRRIHGAVALGVAAATAVLTGALLVGDSVRGSLRELTLDRLGSIDEVLVTDRFFRAELADELRQTEAFRAHYRAVTPAVLFPSVTIQTMDAAHPRRAANVLAVGSDESFWELGSAAARPRRLPAAHEIVLNAPLAAALGVAIGDEVLLRLPQAHQVPADSPLGRKSERVETASGLKVVDIIPAESLGRFALRPSQSLPRNAYLATETLQRVLGEAGRVNALLIAGQTGDQPPDAASSAALAAALAPTLDDFGVRWERVTLRYPDRPEEPGAPVYDYFHLTTDRMIFAPAAREAIDEALALVERQPVLTYLANTIALGDSPEGVPYSTVSAVYSLPVLGPLVDEQNAPIRIAMDEIVLNQWTADELGAQVGDTIRIDFFAPETTHGQAVETSASFRLAAVVPLTEPASGFRKRGRQQFPPVFDQRPTLANDWHLTPVVEGITDQASIDDWDPPFPFDQKRVRTQDDTYWENHRTTPKAFLSFAAGEQLWGSRFGAVTSFRIPAAGQSQARLESMVAAGLRKRQADLGFALQRVKAQGLAAASGTTPFDVLFLFLSFFIIAAALMLVSVLFKLGVDQRVRQIGVLLALGWTRRRTGRWLLVEGVLVSALGGALGVAIGVTYAWLMIAGLRTWWVGAITTPFLELFVTPTSLVAGFVSGVVVSSLTIAWSLRQLKQVATRELLAGRVGGDTLARRRSVLWTWGALVLLLSAGGLVVLATTLGGEAQAGAFVGGGAAMLTAFLLLIWNALRAPAQTSVAAARRLTIHRLALGAAQRNPSRSALTIGLMASACFLIVAMSSFRLDPSRAGAGGFDLVATTSEPVYADLNSAAGRADLFGERSPALEGTTILGLRFRAGDDASCNNLYQATQPRILGATPDFVAHYDAADRVAFEFAASAASTDDERRNPWRLLDRPAVEREGPIPVVLDKNTAMYSLHLYGGIGEQFTIEYEDGARLTFQVAGLVSNSILQGSLVIGERDFVARFPDTSGYRYFLVAAPEEKLADVRALLSDRLSAEGFDPQETRALLAELLRVQNTYLSTFQSLGALGLLLGTFGLATVQLRSVLERRGELALLRAAGFARLRIARLVLTECVVLLVGGLATGVLAALMAVLPHMLLGGASIQLGELLGMLGVVLVVGLFASLLAVRATLRTDLIAALRGE